MASVLACGGSFCRGLTGAYSRYVPTYVPTYVGMYVYNVGIYLRSYYMTLT